MTINPTLRAKVIELYLQKRGRNEIARSLDISQGSVSNILRAYNSKSESTTSLGQNCGQISNKHTTCAEDISTESQTISNVDSSRVTPQEFDSFISNDNASIGVNINNKGSPVLIDSTRPGVGKVATTNTNSNIVIPIDGGPLSHFLGEDTSTDEEVIPSVTSYSNSPSPVTTSPKPEPCSESIPRDLLIKDPDSQDVLEEESELMGVLSPEEIENSKPKESIKKAKAETLFTETNKTPVEERPRQAWDYYGPAWMGILKQIRREKDQRRHELLIIDRRKQKLSEWRKRLEQMQYDLTAREAWILESERFLSLARQLQEMKLALEDALPWIETVKEWAQMQNMGIKTAGLSVAHQLRMYRQLGGLQRSIEQARGELGMLNITITQKQEAITVLTDLLNRGVTESQIVQLINFASEWNKYWQSSTTKGNGYLQEPVNGSNNPGSSGGNGYGGNLSINDLIRLNLLKSTTTNMLNRIETSRTTINYDKVEL